MELFNYKSRFTLHEKGNGKFRKKVTRLLNEKCKNYLRYRNNNNLTTANAYSSQ